MKQSIAFAGLCLLAINANAKTLWSSNNISLFKGNDYTVPYSDTTEDNERSVVTIEHASESTWGDVFMFVDRYDSSDGINETYVEVSPRLSLGKMSGKPLKFGIIKDVLVTSTVEWVALPSVGADATNYLLGPAIDLDLPGFAFFQLNFYHRDNDEGIASNWQFTPAWALPFTLGSQSFSYDGFVDYRSGTEDAHAEANFTSLIRWDAGKVLFNTEKTFYLGFKYIYWQNKLGIEDGTAPFETNEKNLNAMVKFFF